MSNESFSEKATRWLYSLAVIFMLPVFMAYLLWRSLRQPEYRKHWSERFLGRPAGVTAAKGHARSESLAHPSDVLWVHAVSVGETRAAAPLIDAWLAQHAMHRVVLTHTTPTGRATGAALFAQWIAPANGDARLLQSYLPYDFFWANRRFLSWAKPRLGVLMETELWPNLLAQARSMGIAMALINGRLSERSAARLDRFALLARPAIRSLAGIAAQTEDDARRFAPWLPQESMRMAVTGNMKFDVTAPADMLELGGQWRSMLGDRRVWLAASTRDDEEKDLLAAWRTALASGELGANDLLLIVPRHPQRFDRVAQLLKDADVNFMRRSQITGANALPISAATQVFLGDSLGEMFAYLAAADVVLIGGSIPALGGQNPIEACVLGRPVFFGPNMFNFSRIARELQECGAGVRVASAADFIRQGAALMEERQAFEQRSSAARAFAQRHRGATAKTQAFMASLWPSAH